MSQDAHSRSNPKRAKTSLSQGDNGDRLVYAEWGHASIPDPLTRPDPPPALQKLAIRLERKGRGGKSVTVISGFELSEASLEKLAKQLKTQCGTGGTVKDNTIEIQGEHQEKVRGVLKALGYGVK